MKAKKQIDKQILATIISTIIFVIVLVVTVVVVIDSLFGYMKDTVRVGSFLVDYKNGSVVDGKLEVLSNANGTKTDGYEITITNNTKEEAEYYLYIKNKDGSEIDENLMVSLNNYVIKKANTFAQDEDYYIIYEGAIKPGFSSIHTLKFWWAFGTDEEYENEEVEIEYGIIERE